MKSKVVPFRKKSHGYSKATIDDIARSGITVEQAVEQDIREMSEADVEREYEVRNRSGYEIRGRLRLHIPLTNKKGKQTRYLQAAGSDPELFVPVGLDLAKAKKLIVTEGEKKAIAAFYAGLPCVALAGIYNFASKKKQIALLKALRDVAPQLEELEIVFDADSLNEEVRRAQFAFAEAMRVAGTKNIVLVELPEGSKLDDYLLTHTAKEYYALPRRRHSIRDRCEAIRLNREMLTREKHVKIFALVLQDMQENFAGYKVNAGDTDLLYIFDSRRHELYEFTSAVDGRLIARLNELYGINGTEPEWSWLHDELTSHYQRTATPSRIHKLSAPTADGKELCIFDGGNSVFVVSERGVRSEPNGYDSLLFLNKALTKIEPTDKAGADSLRLLVNTPNLIDTDTFTVKQMRMLFEFWIWSLLFPHLMRTRPLLLLYGPKGSFKTSALRRVKHTFEGMDKDVSSVNPEKLSDFVSLFANDFLAVIDNLDGAAKGIENLLAVAATGGNYEERLLYVNGKKYTAKLDAFVAVTSRDPRPFRRDDLVDRTLLLNLERSDKFVAESKIVKETELNRPKFWRYVLNTLPAMLKALRQHKGSAVRYRLADFAEFCVAVAPVLGYARNDIHAALAAHEEYKQSFELETSSLPSALKMLMAKEQLIDMTADELLQRLRQQDPFFPYKNKLSLASALRNQSRALAQHGVVVKGVKGHARIARYTLTNGDAGTTTAKKQTNSRRK